MDGKASLTALGSGKPHSTGHSRRISTGHSRRIRLVIVLASDQPIDEESELKNGKWVFWLRIIVHMPNLTQLRLTARELFDEALRAVNPGAALRRAVSFDKSSLRIADMKIDLTGERPVYAFAIGKASPTMALALDNILGERLAAGVITAGATVPALSSRWRLFTGGHPEPNEQSLAAGQACFELLQRADEERALVIFLISGGGSAMLEWPISEDITRADLRTANRALVTSGASIIEVNAVRRAFSSVKGGRLAARAPHSDQITLIVSDVPPGEESSVASGPTFESVTDLRSQQVIDRYNLRPQLPNSILRAIDRELEVPAPDSITLRQHFVLLDNQSALEAVAEIARRSGFVTEIARDISDQPIADGCELLLTRLEELRRRGGRTDGSAESVCLISGGEFACPVKGDGIGGRNLETALRLAAIARSSDSEAFVALCAGTDGIDGNSPAAGAIVDNTTIERARVVGLDPKDFLDRSDAYSFFVALGDAVATGPTGTNVRDLRILLGSL